MFKPSRRALVIAASFALGLSAVSPAAQAGLLGGDDSADEGVGLPIAGELLGGGLPVVGALGGEGGLFLVGDVLGGEMLDVVTISGLLGSL